MDLREFAALKPGDKVTNPMAGLSIVGEVTQVNDSGVWVAWSRDAAPRHYSVQSTIWTHWGLPETACENTSTQSSPSEPSQS